jgi:hypothetical protein
MRMSITQGRERHQWSEISTTVVMSGRAAFSGIPGKYREIAHVMRAYSFFGRVRPRRTATNQP